MPLHRLGKEMTFRQCRNEGCEEIIEVRKTADGWRPFLESGQMHQCQFSEYAKKQRAFQQEDKNDHGNELPSVRELKAIDEIEERRAERIQGFPIPTVKEYVDHTLAGIPQIITIVGDTAEEMDDFVNSWLRKEHHRIRFKGGQRAYRNKDDRHEITLYYEEIAKQ